MGLSFPIPNQEPWGKENIVLRARARNGKCAVDAGYLNELCICLSFAPPHRIDHGFTSEGYSADIRMDRGGSSAVIVQSL